jgi:phage regulator Rha-like protein
MWHKRLKGKHKNVLRDIANITGSKSGLSKNFAELNFERITYNDSSW